MESVIKKLQDDRINHLAVIVLGCRQVFWVVKREALPITFGIVSAIEADENLLHFAHGIC